MCLFFMGVCTALVENAAAALTRRREVAGGRPGAVMLLTPLALGVRYASCLYRDK